jgi:Bacterial regulatory helix-turn-helix protein, lysR family
MEVRQLRCILVVAEELHFARAAERLHIDQSPLSRTIRELEEDLGAPLFARTTHSTRLTRAGKLFLSLPGRDRLSTRLRPRPLCHERKLAAGVTAVAPTQKTGPNSHSTFRRP